MQNDRPDTRKPRNRRSDGNNGKRLSVRKDGRVGRPVTNDLFCLSGEALEPKPHEYTECGLDNIFLLNGYEARHLDGEEFVAVTDVEGLHRAIGRHLVLHRKGLSPREIKFLRKTMELTQAELAAKLGNDPQSVARWEKGVCEMPGAAEKLLRVVFWTHNILDEERDLSVLKTLILSVLQNLDLIDDKPAQASFRLNNRWDEAEQRAA